MSVTPQRLYTASQVRELDRVAIEDFGIDGYELMKRAGLASFRLLRYHFPSARRIAVYCGSGNNGGDGYVLAALALDAGLQVDLFAVSEAKSDVSRRALSDFMKAGGVAVPYQSGVPTGAEVIVDALLGTGLEQAPAGAYGQAIEEINHTSCPVIALDIPSGLNADTGKILEPCIRACATATFIGRKIGCLTADGPAITGRLYFDDLGVSMEIYDRVVPAAELIDPRRYTTLVSSRPATAHKGNAGRVLIAGGNHGMPGAPCMSARATHRSGAGLVYLATRHAPEHMVSNTLESMATKIGKAEEIDPLLAQADVVAVGPGLGRDDWARNLWERVLGTKAPLVVDADALYLLARTPSFRENWILTPHPGEAARLLDSTAGAVQSDRVAAARELRKRYGGVVVLKGPGTLVLGEELHVCDLGNPGMASGGMGDVLTGVIAGLRAQGIPAEAAACYGVWCHARAGDSAAERGMAGLTAGDLIDELQHIVGGWIA